MWNIKDFVLKQVAKNNKQWNEGYKDFWWQRFRIIMYENGFNVTEIPELKEKVINFAWAMQMSPNEAAKSFLDSEGTAPFTG